MLYATLLMRWRFNRTACPYQSAYVAQHNGVEGIAYVIDHEWADFTPKQGGIYLVRRSATTIIART